MIGIGIAAKVTGSDAKSPFFLSLTRTFTLQKCTQNLQKEFRFNF